MRYPAGPSWQIVVDDPQSLAIALYVRDAARLRSAHAWLPPASPPVAAGAVGGSDLAAEQWDQWWTAAVAGEDQLGGPPDFAPLSGTPELRGLVAAYFPLAVRWSEDRRMQTIRRSTFTAGELLETRLVAELEAAEGRRARPFVLTITELPVEGQGLWELEPNHLLVASALLEDRPTYRRQLVPYVRALL